MDKPETTTITKIMAASPNEFALGIERLSAGMVTRSDGSTTEFALTSGSVRITYTPGEGRRLSPLLVMPSAEVALAFTGVAESDRTAFIAKFDQVFQRGGG